MLSQHGRIVQENRVVVVGLSPVAGKPVRAMPSAFGTCSPR
jgi:hypothetical protein